MGNGVKPPPRDEVKAYCESLGVSFEKFYSHYANVGWIANGYPIANWKALVETWSKRKSKYDFVAQRKRTPEEWLELETRLLQETKARLDEWITTEATAGRTHDFDCVGGHFDIVNGFTKGE